MKPSQNVTLRSVEAEGGGSSRRERLVARVWVTYLMMEPEEVP